MTLKEFNNKYKDYIEEGFDGLEFDIPEVTKFLDDIFENVLTKIPGFQYSQIKLKFNMTRFYTNLKSMHMMMLVEEKIDRLIEHQDNENKIK